MERPQNNASIAAFFDFDGTLIQGESGKYGFKFLREKGFKMPLSFLAKAIFYYALYKMEKITEVEMSDLLLGFYKGKKENDFKEYLPEFFDKYIKPDLSPALLERIKFHRDNGHLLVIASASLCYFMNYVKEKLNFDYALCTELEKDEKGILTGRPAGSICIGEHKKRCVEEFARKYGVDLKESYGYGNHHTDIPFLELVGHPVVVNPTKGLKEYALPKGWEIIES